MASPIRDLTPEQNERAAVVARDLLKRMSMRAIGEALGYRGRSAGSPISRLTDEPRLGGLSVDAARKLCALAGRDPQEALGLSPAAVKDRAALADHPAWPTARAAVNGFDEATIEAAGATVPPRALREVTPSIVRAYASAWAEAAPHAEPVASPHPAFAPPDDPKPGPGEKQMNARGIGASFAQPAAAKKPKGKK